MKGNKTYTLAVGALTAAAYALLTVALAPISYGPVQLRLSELLCILPYYLPCTVPGLFVGCFLANLLTGSVPDMVFGSLATLLAALLTAGFGRGEDTALRRFLACLMPVAVNALVIGAVITLAYQGMGIGSHPGVFALNAGQIALGEGAVLLLGGLPLLRLLPRSKSFRELTERAKNRNDK